MLPPDLVLNLDYAALDRLSVRGIGLSDFRCRCSVEPVDPVTREYRTKITVSGLHTWPPAPTAEQMINDLRSMLGNPIITPKQASCLADHKPPTPSGRKYEKMPVITGRVAGLFETFIGASRKLVSAPDAETAAVRRVLDAAPGCEFVALESRSEDCTTDATGTRVGDQKFDLRAVSLGSSQLHTVLVRPVYALTANPVKAGSKKRVAVEV